MSVPMTHAHHDHGKCIQNARQKADEYCRDNALQLTPVRKRVHEILLGEHRAMGAYDILETLSEEGLGSQPPAVYRALDFLQQHGFVHKIERLNAFVACSNPLSQHTPAFLICGTCKAVAEETTTHDVSALSAAAAAAGFDVDRIVVEAVGTCADCQDA